MTWFTVTEYLCHKQPRICSVCRNHNLVLYLLMIYHWVCNNMGATCGARPGYSSGAHEFTLDFSEVLVCSIFRFLCSALYIIVCPFVIFILVVVLSVLRFTTFYYHFDIFKLFLYLIQYLSYEQKA